MRHLLQTSAVALLLTQPAFAQSSPIEAAVAAGIEQLNAEGANITFSGTEVGSDNSVTYSDVRLAPDEEEVLITVDFITLTPNPDMPGEVTVTMADLVTMEMEPPNGEPMVTIEMMSDNFALTTNWLLGAAGKPMVDLSADSMKITGGSPDHPFLKKLDIAPDGLRLGFTFDEAARDATAVFNIDQIIADYEIVDPDLGSSISSYIEATAQTLSFTGTSLPEDDEDMDAFFADGSFELILEGEGSVSRFASNAPDLPLTMTGTSESGKMAVSLSEGYFVYDTSFGAVDYEIIMDPNVIPFPPFSASMSGGIMVFELPLAPTAGATDVKMALGLRDLAVSDNLWSMIDPGASIPRDPATLEIDISGKLDLNTPLSEMPMTDNPMEIGQVEELNINQIMLAIGGALIEASGGVTVDNSGFMPMPEGAIDISVEGVQTLSQKLVELGLVEQMQVGMVMGMMMAFATPGDAPDTFSSKIEFKDGGILANGQPLQ